ncbi:hypothetical protein OWV82_012484 [Melia azedarach]|uniref:Uncharacterized protein n=1 Tax=Melia azedarach TaxID=155640 RepID=A0ACC1Y3A0_MELAZ|nr:hypothetical protein OWV82_012484 [Melia azedarach]
MEMYWKSGKWRQLFSVSTAVVPMAHATANETGVHFMRFPLLKLSLLFLVDALTTKHEKGGGWVVRKQLCKVGAVQRTVFSDTYTDSDGDEKTNQLAINMQKLIHLQKQKQQQQQEQQKLSSLISI